MEQLNVAIVHDHLMRWGGAERVLQTLHALFPTAPIYTLYADERIVQTYFPAADIRTTFLQRLPKRYRARFRYVAPLAVAAVENIDLQEYNVVISSSAFFAKGVITRPDAVHISYCHTPPRYLWDTRSVTAYEKNTLLPPILSAASLHAMRLWDAHAAQRVDYFVANSYAVKQRIEKYYRKSAQVVYPPVDIDSAGGGMSDPVNRREVLRSLPDRFFLIVSQLHAYKRIDLAVDAFNKMKYPLVIIGDGPQRRELEARAGAHTVFLGRQADDVVQACYERCVGYVYPGEEDFGISAVEAMLHGKPVLAYRKGGVAETVMEGVSGEFFDALHPAVLADGVRRLAARIDEYDSARIVASAQQYSRERFAREFRAVLKKVLVSELAKGQEAPKRAHAHTR